MEPVVHSIFDKQTSTWQYIVACPKTLQAVIIDPVLGLDVLDLKVFTSAADELLEIAASHGYTITRLLETHAHADHLTAAFYLQQKLLSTNGLQVPICIGRRICQVQEVFAKKYGVPESEVQNVFEQLFEDNEKFLIGEITAQVLHLPGHTPDHSGYVVGSNVFTGDSIFNPDVGSARCDFPNGDARVLYKSMQRLLSLPSHFKLYTGHDYPPADSGREPMAFVTVADQLEENKHVKTGTKEEDFVNWRENRDSGLKEPKLLHQALQVNIRGGRFPCGTDSTLTTMLLVPFQIPEVLARARW
ncbi:hypothetical protein N7523_001081 [Penicillium sp. IBT 18751x]|nr:hypothetical protein N7523_001081 [Penicillium sp. IBT 18751x]